MSPQQTPAPVSPTAAPPRLGPWSATPAPQAWGTCNILLVAEREAGSTYHFFRNWRFEAVMDDGHPTSAQTLVAVGIDPAAMVASGSRYAMAFLGERPDTTGEGAAAFSWATATAGASDPVADGLERVKRLLVGTGWVQDALIPTRFAKAAAA